jgi:hypothetical protein
MGGHEARSYWEDWGLVLLWTAMLGGPVAWALHFQISYALVKWACSREQRYVLVATALVAAAAALSAAWLAWRCRTMSRDASEAGGSEIDRSYFMANVALGLDLLLALLIILSAVPPFVLSPCE